MSFFSLLFFGGPEKGRLGLVSSEKCRLVLLNISCCRSNSLKSSSLIYMASLKINTPLSSCLHMSNSASYLSLWCVWFRLRRQWCDSTAVEDWQEGLVCKLCAWLYPIDRSPMERDLDFWLANQFDVPFQPYDCQTTLAGDCEQVRHGEQEHHPAYNTLC